MSALTGVSGAIPGAANSGISTDSLDGAPCEGAQVLAFVQRAHNAAQMLVAHARPGGPDLCMAQQASPHLAQPPLAVVTRIHCPRSSRIHG